MKCSATAQAAYGARYCMAALSAAVEATMTEWSRVPLSRRAATRLATLEAFWPMAQ